MSNTTPLFLGMATEANKTTGIIDPLLSTFDLLWLTKRSHTNRKN
jgi:hypothetical protein